MNYCIIIPTYNNQYTLLDIVERSLKVCPHVIVVNDGSTDSTSQKLEQLGNRINIISYLPNRGKGYALKKGLLYARKRGFDYAITLDSDGQHLPEEAFHLIALAEQKPNDKILVVGARNLTADGMPNANTFANKLSNFWFHIQTGEKLPDTQTGYRLYQLNALPCMKLVTNRYESELELLVLSAWNGVRILSTPISVIYPEERVSHFRPFIDFMRIALLNTCLCIAAILYGYPSKFFFRFVKH